MKRALALGVTLVLTLGTPAAAAVPDTYELPAGFQPEGIAVGAEPYAYLGSRKDGDIYRLDLRTGRGQVIARGPGTPSLGMKLDDQGRLFVAGGSGGDARVVDVRTGKILKSYVLQRGPSFINDVVITGGAAWFTDSANPVLFKLPLGAGGELPATAMKVPLTGAISYKAGINANGIAATPDRRQLIIVQTDTGDLFRTTYAGRTTRIDLEGDAVPDGDGLLLSAGRVLHVVQNRDNLFTTIQLDKDADRGRVLSRIKDPRFDVPTTVAELDGKFYLPNIRDVVALAPAPTGARPDPSPRW